MRKTYIQPESRELICRDALCIAVSLGTEEKGGSNAWSREEEYLDWEDEEQGGW